MAEAMAEAIAQTQHSAQLKEALLYFWQYQYNSWKWIQENEDYALDA